MTPRARARAGKDLRRDAGHVHMLHVAAVRGALRVRRQPAQRVGGDAAAHPGLPAARLAHRAGARARASPAVPLPAMSWAMLQASMRASRSMGTGCLSQALDMRCKVDMQYASGHLSMSLASWVS